MGLQGSFVMDKTGPLPNWAWMGLGLGAAVTFAAIKGSMDKKKKATDDADDSANVYQKYPKGVQPPTYAFVDADSTVITQNAYPPGGGRPPGPGRPHRPDPTPAPKGQWVTVAAWKEHGAPWNSTVYGIAEHLWGNGDAWRNIWNAPENKSLVDKRKTWLEIQAGDKLWVPDVAAGSGSTGGGMPGRDHGQDHGNDDNGPGHHSGQDDNQHDSPRGRPSRGSSNSHDRKSKQRSNH